MAVRKKRKGYEDDKCITKKSKMDEVSRFLYIPFRDIALRRNQLIKTWVFSWLISILNNISKFKKHTSCFNYPLGRWNLRQCLPLMGFRSVAI